MLENILIRYDLKCNDTYCGVNVFDILNIWYKVRQNSNVLLGSKNDLVSVCCLSFTLILLAMTRNTFPEFLSQSCFVLDLYCVLLIKFIVIKTFSCTSPVWGSKFHTSQLQLHHLANKCVTKISSQHLHPKVHREYGRYYLQGNKSSRPVCVL